MNDIKLEEYLSYDTMVELAKEVYKETVRKEIGQIKEDHLISDYDRVISNAVYHYLEEHIDGIVGASAKEIIERKVKKTLAGNHDLHFSIFRNKSPWSKEQSIGQQLLTEAVRNNQALIETKVAEQIEGIDFATLENDITEAIYRAITETLQHRGQL